MSPDRIEALTPSERTVLRKLLDERDQKSVARSLGLSPETVKSHLRNAREKCGAPDSFSLAKALAAHEGSPPEWVIPPRGGEPASFPSAKTQAVESVHELEATAVDQVSEERALFVFAEAIGRTPPSEHERKPSNGYGGFSRLLAATGLAVMIILIIILAFPLSESFQRLANALDPPRQSTVSTR